MFLYKSMITSCACSFSIYGTSEMNSVPGLLSMMNCGSVLICVFPINLNLDLVVLKDDFLRGIS